MAWTNPFAFLGMSGMAGAAGIGAAANAERTPEQKLFDLRKTALDQAAAAAANANPPHKPTLLEYYQFALQLNDRARAEGVTWNAATISDLSGQTLDRFDVRLEHLRPDPNTAEGRETMAAMRGFVQPENLVNNRSSGVDALVDSYDLDGDRTINAFFAEAGNYQKFNGTSFVNTEFHPATTLRLMDHAVGAKFSNVTLYGLQDNETLVLGTPLESRGGSENERYRNVTVESAAGGTVHINSNAIVDGLTIKNGRPVLEVASRGQINNLSINPLMVRNENGELVPAAPTTTLLTLNLEQNSKLFMPELNNVTVAPGSRLNGAIIEGNNGMDGHFTGFRNVNMQGVSMEGTQLIALTFENVLLREADLKGARITNSIFNGQNDLTNADLSGASLHNVRFMQGDLTGVDLSGARLASVQFNGTNLADADFSGANLANVTFTDVNLANINFDGANFSNVTVINNGVRRVVNSPEELAQLANVQSQMSGIFSGTMAALNFGGSLPPQPTPASASYETPQVQFTATNALVSNPGGMAGSGAEDLGGGDVAVAPQPSGPSTITGGQDIDGIAGFEGDRTGQQENQRALTTPEALAARVQAIMDQDLGIS